MGRTWDDARQHVFVGGMIFSPWPLGRKALNVAKTSLPRNKCNFISWIPCESIFVVNFLSFFSSTKLKNIQTLDTCMSLQAICTIHLRISYFPLYQVSWQNLLEPTMVQGNNDGIDKDMVLPLLQQRPAVRALPAWLSLIVVSILHFH